MCVCVCVFKRETGSLTCLCRARGEGLGVGGAMRGRDRDGGDRGWTGEMSGTWSREWLSQGWEWTDITETAGRHVQSIYVITSNVIEHGTHTKMTETHALLEKTRAQLGIKKHMLFSVLFKALYFKSHCQSMTSLTLYYDRTFRSYKQPFK